MRRGVVDGTVSFRQDPTPVKYRTQKPHEARPMKVTFEIDTSDNRPPHITQGDYRAAAAYLLHLAGDLTMTEETPNPKGSPAAIIPVVASNAAPVVASVLPPPPIVPAATASNIPPPPPVPMGTTTPDGDDDEAPPSNVVQGNFPLPPPPPIPPITGVTLAAPSSVSATPVVAPVAATTSVVAEVDSAGMPYDARIHQKSKNKKKDGTWKLIKGIDTNIVTAVTAELAARKAVAAGTPPPAPVTVSLPPGASNTVPVPPVTVNAPVAGVPTPPVPPSVPVPPVPAAGGVGSGLTFRSLIEKITEATKQQKITPAKVAEICQMHGAPSLMQLNSMPHLLADVNSSIDAAVLGL